MKIKPNTVSAVIDALTALHAELTATAAIDSTVYEEDESEAFLDALPVGAKVRDVDADVWTKKDTGWHRGGTSFPTPTSSVATYVPLRVIDLPAPTPEPEPEPVYTAGGQKVPAPGDRVRVIRGFHYSNIIDGRVGVLDEIRENYSGTGRRCFLVHLDGESDQGYGRITRTAGEVEVIETPAAPAPVAAPADSLYLDFTSVSGLRRVQVEPMCSRRLSLTIRGTEVSSQKDEAFVHLSADDARKLADVLTAFADQTKETTS